MRRETRRWVDFAWILLLATAAGAAARGSRRQSPFGKGLSLAELRDIARRAGFSGGAVDVAAAVAMAESGGNIYAQGDPEGPFATVPNGVSRSYGLWQVHVPAHPEFDARRLLEPDYNAWAAHRISQGGADWSPWTTYRNGAYRAFMPAGTT